MRRTSLGFTWLRALAFVFLGVLVAGPGLALAKDKRQLEVMTQNLYLGASLEAALTAPDAWAFLEAVTQIYTTVQYTGFPLRAQAIAAEIAATAPDVIGLQEATHWTASGPSVYPSLDFLDILLSELDQLGLDYSVAAVSYNANIGPVPLFACYEFDENGWPLCTLTLQDRDVILVKAGNSALQIRSMRSGQYENQVVLNTPVGPLSFDRGWVFIDGLYEGKKFRFLNTHLEEETFADVQEAQAVEFLVGPARQGGAVIAVGDFNSAADGSTTMTYALLTLAYFEDAWDNNPGDPGFTCCQEEELTNPDSMLYQRIDLVLTHGASRALDAALVNDLALQAVDPLVPVWPSDHAGVVSTVRIH